MGFSSMVGRLTALILVVAGPLFCLASWSGAQQIQKDFQSPPKAYRPMVRWWWPGGDVRDDELRHEVQLLDEANFGGGEIQPFTIGLNPKMQDDVRARVDDYLTPTFYGHVRAALEEVQKRGLWIDYTFGSGWPFGGGEAITPELASLELRFTHQSIHGPIKLHQKLDLPQPQPGAGTMFHKAMGITEVLPSGWPERLEKRSKLVAVVALRGHEGEYEAARGFFSADAQGTVKKPGILDPSSTIVLTSHISADGILDWDVPEGDWLIFTFRQLPADLRVVGGAGKGPQLVLDHMKREAFDAHAHRIGDSAQQQVGDYFGKAFRAMFCDSLEVTAYIYWTDNFLEEFQRRRGYDLTPYLPILRQPGFADPYGSHAGLPLYDMPGIGDKIRTDYWQTVSDLFVDNFYQPFADWNAHHNLLARTQAHGAPADILKIYGLSSIPETEQLYDNGRFDFLKMSSSAADVYGKKIVSSESFVFMGDPYINTPEAFKRNADKLITAGINEIIYHGFPYEYMDRPEPGWHPFSPPFPFSSHLNRHNTFWPYMPAINAYITRLQYLSQQGTSVVPVAIYRNRLSYDGIQPVPPEPDLDTRLLAAGYSFDHVNTDVLLKSHLSNKRLVTPGTANFSALMFQDESALPLPLAQKLAEFVRDGLPVVFIGATPKSEAGFLDAASRTQKIQALMTQVLSRGTSARALASAEEAVNAIQKTAQPNLTFAGPTSVPFIEKRIGPLDAFFLRNPDESAKSVELSFTVEGSPQRWDPWTGKSSPFNHFERQGNMLHLHLDLTAYGSALIVFDPADNHSPQAAPHPAEHPVTVAIGESGWSFHGIGLGPDGKQVTVDLQMSKLIDWAQTDNLKAFSGRGTYRTHFTLGQDLLRNNQHLLLSLGEVRDVAEIKLNGKAGPTLLLHPYEAAVTELVKAGDNLLEITVVNSLSNAMRSRVAAGPAWMAPAKTQPRPSGLLGPVRLIVASLDEGAN